MTTQTVTVQILNKAYQVACPEEEVESLTAAASYLDKQMCEIRDSGKVVGLDRIAVMAALNIAHDLLYNKDQVNSLSSEVERRITLLNDRVGKALDQHRELES